MSPNILAIDTSTEACSVALQFNNQVSSDFVISNRDHTKQVLPMVDTLLKRSECNLNQIDAIAFGQGPGSFTGVRIGIGVAQGLAFGIGVPMIGVSNLMTLAQGAYRKTHIKTVVAAIDARMSEIYLGVYQYNNDVWQAMINECVIKPDQVSEKLAHLSLTDCVCSGTGWQTYPNMLKGIMQSDYHLPEAQDMLKIAENLFSHGRTVNPEDAQASYLRNEVTWKKLPGRN